MQNTEKSLLNRVDKVMKEEEKSKNVLSFNISQKGETFGLPNQT